MSAEASGWTFRHSPFTGAALLVHLAIADSVNDQHGNEFWMGQTRLADKARISRKAANQALATLMTQGFVTLLEDNARAGKANRYRFEFPDVPVKFDSRARQGVTPGYTPGVTRGDTPVTRGGTRGVTGGDTEPKVYPKGTQARADTRQQDPDTQRLEVEDHESKVVCKDLAAIDALPPEERAALLAAARARHPLLRQAGAADDHPMVRAEALNLYREQLAL